MQRMIFVVQNTMSPEKFLGTRRNHDATWRTFDKARLFTRSEDATQATYAISQYATAPCRTLGLLIGAEVPSGEA